MEGQEIDFIFKPEPNQKPVKVMENGCNVLSFPQPHQDPGSALLDVSKPLETPGISMRGTLLSSSKA